MAEFCPDCLEKMLGEKCSRWRYVISFDKELCEECGELKPVVICRRRLSLFADFLSGLFEKSRHK